MATVGVIAAPSAAGVRVMTEAPNSLQAKIAEVAALGGSVVQIPRGEHIVTPFSIPDEAGVSLVGVDRWSSSLRFTSSPGANLPLIDLGATYAFKSNRISDLTIRGPSSALPIGGFPTDCYGVKVSSGWLFERVNVRNCKAGFAVDADHVTWRSCSASSCGYGMYWLPTPTTYGDYEITSTDTDGNTLASVAVASDNVIDGAVWTRCHFGNSPYCFLKESGSPGSSGTGLVISSLFQRCGFEAWGTAIFKSYDDRNLNATFVECNLAGAFFPDFFHPTDPRDALVDMAAGTITVKVRSSNPFWKPGAQAIFKGSLTGCRIESADAMMDNVVADGKPVAVGSVANCHLQTPAKDMRLGVAKNAVSRYDLVENDGYEDVKQYAAADSRALQGVAEHAATTGQIVAYSVSGRTSVKRAGTNIPTGGRYLKPHASTAGAVDLASAYSDGPVVAISEADSSGATVPVLLRGLT